MHACRCAIGFQRKMLYLPPTNAAARVDVLPGRTRADQKVFRDILLILREIDKLANDETTRRRRRLCGLRPQRIAQRQQGRSPGLKAQSARAGLFWF